MGREFDRSVFVGIGLVAVLVAATAGVCLWNTRQFHHNADRVAHTHAVRAATATVRADRRAMEAAQRTFLLTGDESTYAAYRRAEAAVRGGLVGLRQMTADNPEQQARVAAVGDALDRTVARLETTAVVRRREGAEAAGRLVAEGVSRGHLDEADRLTAGVEDAEQALLADRTRANDEAYANALLFGTAAAGFGLLAVGMFVWLLRRSTRTRAEAAAAVLRERELLDATLSSIGDGVIATDAAGNVTFLNGVAQALTGWSQADAAGHPLTEVFDIVNETTREPVDNPALRALEKGVIVGLANHTILIARDGAERPIDDSAAPIRAGGRVSGAVLVFRDIGDRKAADAELARANAETARQKRLYDTVLSATPDFVYVFGLDHTVLYANDSLVAMWGVGDPVGKTFLEIGYPAWHAEMHDREIDRVRATKRPVRGEVPFDGTLGRRVYDYIFVPVFGADGEVEAVAGTTRDVTERKAGEEKLRLLDAVGEAVRPAADPVAVMAATTRLLGEHLGATRVAYADLEPDGDRFTIRHDWTAAGVASTVGTYSLDAFGPRAAELRAGRTLVVRDVDAELTPAEGGDTFTAIGIKAVVCYPLVKGGRLLAMMAAHQAAPRDWTPGEVALIGEVVERSWAHVERVGAAAAMRASDERFRIVARATNDAVWDWDMRTNGVWWNEGVTTLFGHRREDVGADAAWWTAQIHPDDRERVATGIHAVIDHGGSKWSDEYRFRRADGTYATVLDRGYAIHEGGGKTVRLVGAMQDVTERKQAEARLRASEEQLRVAVGAAKLGQWTLDLRTMALTCSDGCKANFGRGPGDSFTYEELWAAVHPDDLERVREAVHTAVDTRSDYDTEYRAVWPGGSLHWVLVRGRASYTPEGEPAVMTGVTLDITDRKLAEEREQKAAREALATAEAVRFLSDASASLAELVDYESTLQRIATLAVGRFADWCVVDVLDDAGNRRRLAVNGVEGADQTSAGRADAAVGVPHVLRTGEPELVPDVAALDPATAKQGAERVERLRGWGIESYLAVPLISRGKVIGGITFLSASARRRYGREELLLATELAVRVTTAIENASLYRTLQEQDRRKDEFLATLAHELRNPLAPVRNGVQILRATLPSDELTGKALTMMDRQLGHMVHLVDDLMDVARVSSGKVVLRKERVELRAVVDAAVESTRQVVEGGGHALGVDLPAEPLAFDADKTRLVQVLANLLSNAAKYTPHGGRLSLSAVRTDGHAVVRVADTGVGISAEMLPKVFDMFTQVGSSLERSQGGLGIGLTLVKRLVEMHGGSVSAESAGPGKGSAFTVRLPLAATTAAADVAPPEVPPTSTRLQVLVVDDNVDAAESLAMLLELKGHEVRTAHDGPEALRVLGSYRPSLIVLDIGLPGMSGYEVARRIRESGAHRGVTLAALTGWGQEEDRKRSREAGFDHHLTKPADPEAVERILVEVGDARR